MKKLTSKQRNKIYKEVLRANEKEHDKYYAGLCTELKDRCLIPHVYNGDMPDIFPEFRLFKPINIKGGLWFEDDDNQRDIVMMFCIAMTE